VSNSKIGAKSARISSGMIAAILWREF